MEELAGALDSTAGIFAVARRAGPRIRARAQAWTPAPLGELPLDALLEQYVPEHPLSRHYLDTGDQSALNVNDLLHERDWRRTDVYHSARTLAGFTRHISVALPAPAGDLRALLIGRPGRNYDDSDRAFLQRVQPLLVAADAAVRQLRRWRESIRAAAATEGVAAVADAAAALDDVVAAVRLTPREAATLSLLAGSLTAEAIGRQLGISTGTVHKHLGSIYRKLGTSDRLATVLRAQQLGLLPS